MQNFVCLVGENDSDCGYCKQGTSHSFGVWAYTLSVDTYQAMIDVGWRRSGKYLYKPNLNKSCCPPYTIRLNVQDFILSKGQKKVLKKVNRFLEEQHDQVMQKDKDNRHNSTFESLVNELDIQVKLEPSEFNTETFELYKKYQTIVHDEENPTPEGFKRFLVDSPLTLQDGMGSFHQKYYYQDKLIAVGFIDILPKCVSSVYFIYDPMYSKCSMGTLSALYEIYFTTNLCKKMPDCHYYYLGFYIHSCPKMRYKAQYKPSQLLCPDSMEWVPLDNCLEWLDKQPVTALTGEPLPRAIHSKSTDLLGEAHVYLNGRVGIIKLKGNEWEQGLKEFAALVPNYMDFTFVL